MKHYTGVWMDHRKAIIVRLETGEPQIVTVTSDAHRPSKSSGGHHQKAPNAHQDVVAEDHRQHRYLQEMNTFYEKIFQHLLTADEMLLLGPGQSKKKFNHFVEQRHPGTLRLKAMHATGLMEPAEVMDYVCRVFKYHVH
ncbi:hypothetical protein [Marinobacter caseinilyticus]|uniref:hypothetical protein n=1 Tax=Marinobacter caseinilyticus TaxID=2692195 RepID=UPI00140992CD|nr:hypothetical protein [Marinobacter caseinilyticus]